MRNVKHEADGAWTISSEDGTWKVEFYKDEAGLSITTTRRYRTGDKWEVVTRCVIIDDDEVAFLKQYLTKDTTQ